MLSVNQKTIGFDEVQARVTAITDTENTFKVEQPLLNVCDMDNFSDFGLKSMGKMVGFPAEFVRTLAETGSKPLGNRILLDRTANYFTSGKAPFYAREFCGKICGVVSNRYAYFDDNEVCDIIGGSPFADFGYQYAGISPERLHLRAIDKENPFKVDGDDSNADYVTAICGSCKEPLFCNPHTFMGRTEENEGTVIFSGFFVGVPENIKQYLLKDAAESNREKLPKFCACCGARMTDTEMPF